MNNKELLKYLKINNFIPSKKMGQNFLICDNYKRKIIDSLDIKDEDNIIEIGPGFGALTFLLYEINKNLILIELDKRIYSYLNNNFNNIQIINDNFLNINIDDLCRKDQVNKIISNLPYSISSKAIIKIIKSKYIDLSILMIQKEVADRLLSKECSNSYNGFSVLIQLTTIAKKLFDVPNTIFYPKPSVTSSIIKLENIKNLDFDINKMEKFLRKCFGKKRKTIINNLKDYYDSNEINETLNKLNIERNRRPETISVNDYKNMYKYLES